MCLSSCCRPDFPWACGNGLEAKAKDPFMQLESGRKTWDPGLCCVPISYPATECIFFPWLFLAM